MSMDGSNTPVLLQQITELWQQVLPATPAEPDTHFFVAGGDSLQLGRLLLRVREQLGIELRLQDLPHFSTPRKMAQWCDPLVARATRPVPATRPATVQNGFAASSSQQGLWWSEQLAGAAGLETGLYNSGVVIELRGALQWQLLAAAINALMLQFPLLASCLQIDPHRRRLLVRSTPAAPRLEAPATVTPDELPALAAAWLAEPFDLACNVFRCRLLRHDSVHHSLLLCGHHCVLDGWSGGVLLQQLARNYRELDCNPRWQPIGVDTAFAEHCQRQQQQFGSDAHLQQLHWWRHYMGPPGEQEAALPWQPQARHWPYRVQQLSLQLPTALLPRLQTVCAESHCTLFAVLATALAAALRSVAGVAHPVIGFPLAGRATAPEESSVGCYMQLLPLKLGINDKLPLLAQLAAVHETVQAVLAHAVPLPELVRALRPHTLPDGNVWFDLVLALQNFPQSVCDWSPLTANWRALPATHGQYLLKLEVAGDTLTAEYAEAVVPSGDVQQLLQRMQQALQQLAG